MYLQTLSISDFDIEKAEAVSCHSKRFMQRLFSIMNLLELSATFSISYSSDIFGDREARK